jgi:cytidylate kinase
MIITIDGPVATGKSTIARKLALALGYIYFDTGAMYRALTYGILKNKINVDDPQQLTDYLHKFHYNIRARFGEKAYFVDHEDVTEAIRKSEVTSQVSRISAIPAVRERLVVLQRDMASGVHAVFEGRDMGTVVFPDAGLKIFLSGRPEVRAKRRFDELKTKYPQDSADLTMDKVLEDLNKRDLYDSTRAASPLKKADDAYEVDTSDLSPDEIVTKILELRDVKSRKRK